MSRSKKTWKEYLPDESLEVCEENLNEFFLLMYERQMIWVRKHLEKKPFPWTNNKFFRDYKFTNIYRELDRSSQYLINKVHLNPEVKDFRDFSWRVLLYRIFNNPDTFEYIGGIPSVYEFDKKVFRGKIDDFRKSGGNPFTNAYMVNAAHCKGRERHLCYCDIAVPVLHALCMSPKNSLTDRIEIANQKNDVMVFINAVTQLPMIAEFVAHEFFLDFCYIHRYRPEFSKYWKFDQNSFTNVGPGASLGIRLLFPSTPEKKKIQRIYDLRDMAESMFKKLGVKFPYLGYDLQKGEYYISDEFNLNLHSSEFLLCEYQKYWKMKIGEGKQRMRYEPRK